MRKLMQIATLLAVALAVAMPAKADSICASGATCTVLLNTSNVVQLAGVVVTVTINNTGSTTVLGFQLTTNPLVNAPIGIDQIGWSAQQVIVGYVQHGNKPPTPVFGPNPGALSSSSTNFGGNQATTISGSGQMDGFGTFNVQAADPASTGGVSSPITFTLGGLITSFPSNSYGNVFVVHMRFGNCSGWVGGPGGSTSPTSDPNCVAAPPPVPEPSSLVLLGTGLVGIATLLRRRLFP